MLSLMVKKVDGFEFDEVAKSDNTAYSGVEKKRHSHTWKSVKMGHTLWFRQYIN